MKLPPFAKTYDGITVLDFPGMDLEPGTIYGVIGSNGSGKSTFSKILSGVLTADQGRCAPDSPSVGYLPQKPHAFRMTVRNNLLLSGRDPARAETLLTAMGISHLADKPAHRLSGGETARMALARLMMKSYGLLILDEPTAAMDMEATVLAEELILDYVRETGCALILVTHSLQQARRLSDQVLYFHKGRLLEHGPTAQVLEAPAQEQTRRFLDFYGIR